MWDENIRLLLLDWFGEYESGGGFSIPQHLALFLAMKIKRGGKNPPTGRVGNGEGR